MLTAGDIMDGDINEADDTELLRDEVGAAVTGDI